jgi:hypothetical protein
VEEGSGLEEEEEGEEHDNVVTHDELIRGKAEMRHRAGANDDLRQANPNS